jgi:hypothetical protein
MNSPFPRPATTTRLVFFGAEVTGGAGAIAQHPDRLRRNVTARPHHGPEGGTATVDDGGSGMTDHNGVLMMQRALLAGTLGLAMARKAAAILEGDPRGAQPDLRSPDDRSPDDRSKDGAVLRAILDAANECLGHFDDRPAAERWCDTLFHLLDLAAFASELGGHG